MADAERNQEIEARFDDAKLLLSFGAACVWMADLDLLADFYERASSAQEVAGGGVTLEQSTTAERWREKVQAAIAFKATVEPITDDVLSVVRERVFSHRAGLEADLVVEWAACPGCGERRMDELTVQDDGSVVCATCGRHYDPAAYEPASEEDE